MDFCARKPPYRPRAITTIADTSVAERIPAPRPLKNLTRHDTTTSRVAAEVSGYTEREAGGNTQFECLRRSRGSDRSQQATVITKHKATIGRSSSSCRECPYLEDRRREGSRADFHYRLAPYGGVEARRDKVCQRAASTEGCLRRVTRPDSTTLTVSPRSTQRRGSGGELRRYSCSRPVPR